MLASEIKNFEELLETAEGNAVEDWDMEFVADIRTKFERHGGDAFISEKQLNQLERIAGE